MKNKTIGIVIMLLLLLPVAAGAQQKGSIELKSVAEVDITTTNVKGEKEVKRVDVSQAKVVPGDTVIYTTTYTNIGNKPAENVVITNPLNPNLLYVDQSAEGADTKIDFSADGGKNYAAPDKLVKTDAGGKTRKATAADYTNIRWTVIKPVPPGGTGSVSFRARVK